MKNNQESLDLCASIDYLLCDCIHTLNVDMWLSVLLCECPTLITVVSLITVFKHIRTLGHAQSRHLFPSVTRLSSSEVLSSAVLIIGGNIPAAALSLETAPEQVSGL